MDVTAILARIDAGKQVTCAELGYLLPELERRGAIDVEMAARCCKKIFARIYRYRGKQLLWVGRHRGYYPDGIGLVPALAGVITPDMVTPALAAITCCWQCGQSWRLILEAPMTVGLLPGPPPIFTEVAG